MSLKIFALLCFLLLGFGCNILGESEIDDGFIFGAPSDGLVFWIDAATDVDVTYGTGSEIQDVYDKNGNGVYMNCPTNPPEYQNSQLNGKGGMVTSVVPTCTVYYTLASSTAGDRFTFFVVSKITIDDVNPRPLDLFSIDTSGELAGLPGKMYASGNLKDPAVITFEVENSISVSVYRNSVPIIVGQDATGVNISASNGAAMTSYASGSTIYEMILYERSLSTNERAAIENYLISKWGL